MGLEEDEQLNSMSSEEDDYSDMAEDEADGSDMQEDETNGSDMAEDEDEFDEADSSAATSGQKQYKILKEEDVKLVLENDISTVCDALSVSRGVACALLCRNKWIPESACEYWPGADDDGERNPDPAVIEPVCKICFEESLPENMASAACGHLFCAECWKTYIATAVSDGAACLTLCCPDPDCKVAVTLDMVEMLSSEAEIKEYNRYLLRSYVESNQNIKWCPAAGCDRAVEFDSSLISEKYEVVCDRSHEFCWNCLEEHHRPAEWMEKNRSEAENTNWILAYTKPCPKCKRSIEKNQGCNHMTCTAPCGHQFCWLCGAPWRGHGRCNEFVDTTKEKAKRTLARYVYFYERWHSHDRSIKIAMNNLDKARAKLDGEYWQMKFVVEAWELVVKSLRVLRWSYPYGYYLPEDYGKSLFESMLGEAEETVERLHGFVEKEMIDDECFQVHQSEVLIDFRAKLSDQTTIARRNIENLVCSFENDFPRASDHLLF